MEQRDYTLKIFRVNLTTGRVSEEHIDGETTRMYVGGTGLGTKYLWDEVTTLGACTGMAGTSQANGYFGAYMRFNGIDGIIVEGAAKPWTRIHIHDGKVELINAEHLLGKDTWETEDAVKEEIGNRCSVYSIGPAGENLVRFSAIVGDRGHVAAHNGVGTVMASKKIKCLSVERGNLKPRVVDPERLRMVAKELSETARKVDPGLVSWGTNFGFVIMKSMGFVPVKNYTTNIFPEMDNFTGEYLRTHFKAKPMPCHACTIGHCRMMEVTEGPYKGFVGEEPEYEGMAAMGPVIGNTDPGAAVMLGNLVDRLGFDINESGYMMGFIIECYERGILKKSDLDGYEMQWGNVESVAAMLRKIAYRDGCGDIFADGLKRAADRIGGEAVKCAVTTLKGASPRGHDHRAHWMEFIDTCLSNTGTIETGGQMFTPPNLGLEPVKDRFDPIAMSTMNAKLNGGRNFEDSLGICRLCTPSLKLTLDCLNAVTGWDFKIEDAVDAGVRIVNLMRMFNFRHGLTKEIEGPSERYSSTPVDGPAEGKSIRIHWDTIRDNYYKQMGWDVETGKPLPETLKRLGLEFLVKEL
jgi:aldehyde:ferredoxin oxidoreductase